MADPDYLAYADFAEGRQLVRFASQNLRRERVEAPRAYVTVRDRWLVRAFLRLKRLARVLVLALYAFPIAIVVKIVLWAMDNRAGDWITVGFVGLVVALFAVLAALVGLYPFVGPPSRRHARARLDLDLPRAGSGEAVLARAAIARGDLLAPADVELLTTGPMEGAARPLRVRGRLFSGHDLGTDEPAIIDAWVDDDGTVARLFAGHTLVLRAENQPPVVVAFEAPPIVVTDYRPGDALAAPALRDEIERNAADVGPLDPEALRRAELASVRDGDEVEIVARGYRVLPNLDTAEVGGRKVDLARGDERGAGPYRDIGSGRGLLLVSEPDAPLVLIAPPS